jgi:hypothetical protein
MADAFRLCVFRGGKLWQMPLDYVSLGEVRIWQMLLDYPGYVSLGVVSYGRGL